MLHVRISGCLFVYLIYLQGFLSISYLLISSLLWAGRLLSKDRKIAFENVIVIGQHAIIAKENY